MLLSPRQDKEVEVKEILLKTKIKAKHQKTRIPLKLQIIDPDLRLLGLKTDPEFPKLELKQ